MEICVCGWYFFPELTASLDQVHLSYPVTVISHKDCDIPHSFPIIRVPNIGLEFGAYDHFLKNVWSGKDDVLFMHDDASISDIKVFDRISGLNKDEAIDQAYLFKNENEEKNNGGKHGRAIFISGRLLKFMIEYECTCNQSEDHFDTHNPDALIKGTGPHKGFWFDPINYGHTEGKPQPGIRHYNDMIYHFHVYMGRMRDKRYSKENFNVVKRVFFPELNEARRGVFREER
jgi:hypothetical protein